MSTSNLVRKVQVVAHRLAATEITAWVHGELNGYTDSEALPATRNKLMTTMSVSVSERHDLRLPGCV